MGKNKQFIKTIEGDIYKMTSNNNIFLKVSPYSMNEDRRIDSEILLKRINNNEASFINKNKAFEEINALWREHEMNWIYCGKQYKVKKEHFSFGQAKEHKFPHTYVGRDNERHTYLTTYFLCMFHGKLCWVQHSHYYPRMEVYKFTNFETEPSYTDFMQWTDVKNLKNIYCKNYEGKWEVI